MTRTGEKDLGGEGRQDQSVEDDSKPGRRQDGGRLRASHLIGRQIVPVAATDPTSATTGRSKAPIMSLLAW